MSENNNNSIISLFDSILDDATEKKIMNLIIDNRSVEVIVEELLNIKNHGADND